MDLSNVRAPRYHIPGGTLFQDGGTAVRLTRRRIAAIAVAALLAAPAADYVLYPRLAGVGGEHGRSGDAGIWLRYWWYTGERTEDQRAQTALALKRRGFRYLYCHVGEIGGDGRLERGRLRDGEHLIRGFAEDPDLVPIAWILAKTPGIGGPVDISRRSVREAMVEEGAWLVEECGFAGVQWDWEYAPGATDDLVALLRETRGALPEGAIVSIATPCWRTCRWLAGGWSEADFERIAPECDEVCVMCYDTAMFLPRAYVWLTRRQMLRVPAAVARGNPECRVLIGLPTYGDRGSLSSHHAHAENVRMGLKGVREGLATARGRGPVTSTFAGPAIFANWTTDEAEWETWDELWLDGGEGDEP